LIQQILHAKNLARTFTFTVTGLGAMPAGINSFQVDFTQPGEFDAPSKNLKIVLSPSKSFGIL
jgi:hypothetical protein